MDLAAPAHRLGNFTGVAGKGNFYTSIAGGVVAQDFNLVFTSAEMFGEIDLSLVFAQRPECFAIEFNAAAEGATGSRRLHR